MSRQGKARVLTKEERRRVEKVALLTRHPLRNRAMLYASFGLGLRACEIRRLRIKDVADASLSIYTEVILEKRVTKGNKQRECYITNKKVREVLSEYVQSLKAHAIKKRIPFCMDDPLFSSNKGGEFLPNTIVRAICNMYKAAGLYGAKSHSGRRTFITTMSEEGFDLKSIGRLVGHSSIAQTAEYIEANPNRLKKIAEKSVL